jgi:hypothetical protein
MTYKYEMSAPGPLAPGNTQHHALTTSACRLVSRVWARIASAHLAVRFAASAAFGRLRADTPGLLISYLRRLPISKPI